ncbi:hypothetical protein [Nostoc sp. MG11]|uniref:hypothetical protein n=1 Tax=Nostoc sp. MG11 TaxID=2721166 RepID=UPI0018679380|nr:hypothetical protein [Nostoc sp. MG11]
MFDILSLLQCLLPQINATTMRRLSQIVMAMLVVCQGNFAWRQAGEALEALEAGGEKALLKKNSFSPCSPRSTYTAILGW